MAARNRSLRCHYIAGFDGFTSILDSTQTRVSVLNKATALFSYGYPSNRHSAKLVITSVNQSDCERVQLKGAGFAACEQSQALDKCVGVKRPNSGRRYHSIIHERLCESTDL